ncbi:hypothetical protein BKA66DRAFT_603019 [Pyrenochaeta sp. MPI-SDFR-AT-0127]|nr:hypothetical protein BKA66DRAFT_603019 [Pyrenochaeta sp. MPI-SDFR-AT-0127]
MPPQTDGVNESKRTTPPSTQRPGFRKRIANLFRSSGKKPDMDSDQISGDEVTEDTSPMRVISPRVTELEPSTPRRKEHSFSFHTRRSKAFAPFAGTPARARECETVREGETSGAAGLAEGEYGSVGDVSGAKGSLRSPLGSKMQMTDGIDVMSSSVPTTPASPSREAALTSHPILVGKERDGSDKYERPIEGERVRG